jgi:hypothetical protein
VLVNPSAPDTNLLAYTLAASTCGFFMRALRVARGVMAVRRPATRYSFNEQTRQIRILSGSVFSTESAWANRAVAFLRRLSVLGGPHHDFRVIR